MIFKRTLTVSAFILISAACDETIIVTQHADATDPLEQAVAVIKPDALRAHVEFLADDLLEGRGNGTRGYDIAAKYVATQFALHGLEPAGDDGTYLQAMPMRSARLVEEGAEVTASIGGESIELVNGEDYVLGGNYNRTETDLTAEVIFVGFGVTAPEIGYDDYADVDVEGKIILVMGGAPASFPHNQRAYYSSGLVKSANAVKRGAIGYIGFFSPEDAKRVPWSRVVSHSVFPRMRWLDQDGEPANAFPELQASATFSLEGGRKLLVAADKTLEEIYELAAAGTPQSMPTGVTATIRYDSVLETISSPNVIAVAPGSDPVLSSEYVIFTAHLDHMGIGVPKEGDDIYNGAYDNAAGVSILLEVARAFSSLPKAPARSLIFLVVAGEERGLLGSDFYANQSSSPIANIVANVNFDMPVMIFPFSDIIAFGAEHSSLANDVEAAARRFGFDIAEDPFPEEVIFIRSDQYSLVKKGIPAVFMVPGFGSSDPSYDGAALFREHLQTIYHSPQDDTNLPFFWDTGVRFTQANFVLGHEIANRPERPTWNEGDFFGDKFAPSR